MQEKEFRFHLIRAYFILRQVDPADLSPRLDAPFNPPQLRLTHPLEKALLGVVAIQLVCLPWAMGGMRIWAQYGSLGFALFGIAIALLPRNYGTQLTGGASFRRLGAPRLLCFPIFWLGLIFIGYIAIQLFNPLWIYRWSGSGWWMERQTAISWLPHGYVAPFGRWNGWRSMIVYLSPWLTVCSIWVGFTRRRTLLILAGILIANGFILGAVGIAQRVASRLPNWLADPGRRIGAEGYATFFYRNHAAAYLNLIVVIAFGVAAWYFVRGARHLHKSNPGGVYIFAATVLAVSVLVSRSRGGSALLLVLVAVAAAAFILHELRRPSSAARRVAALGLVLIVAVFAGLTLSRTGATRSLDRVLTLRHFSELNLDRRLAVKAAVDMLQHDPIWGSGAGSFRYLFPLYQQRYPSIFRDARGKYIYWEHAHNDLLEIPIEFGLAGSAILAFGFGWWLTTLGRSRVWQNVFGASVVVGLLLTIVHAGADFVFQNPAVLQLWCCLWPITTLWTKIERKNVVISDSALP